MAIRTCTREELSQLGAMDRIQLLRKQPFTHVNAETGGVKNARKAYLSLVKEVQAGLLEGVDSCLHNGASCEETLMAMRCAIVSYAGDIQSTAKALCPSRSNELRDSLDVNLRTLEIVSECEHFYPVASKVLFVRNSYRVCLVNARKIVHFYMRGLA